MARDPQKLGRGDEGPTLEASEGAWPCQYLDFVFWTLQLWDNKFMLFLCHPVCDALFQPPQETHTETIVGEIKGAQEKQFPSSC